MLLNDWLEGFICHTGFSRPDRRKHASFHSKIELLQAKRLLTNAPVASLFTPGMIAEGSSLSLDASSSYDDDSDSLTYRWDVDGDGTFGDEDTGSDPYLTLDWSALQGFGFSSGSTIGVGVEVSDGTFTATMSD